MRTHPNPTTPDTNRPVHSLRYGVISASIWQQESERGPMYNVTFQRSYKEGENWKSSASFGRSDLLVLSLLATKAFEWIAAQSHPEKPEV